MDTSIRWLHLTDLHVGMHDQDWLWPRMRDKFFADLKTLCETDGPWDLVLFTGDLVQKGTEYENLNRIFEKLWRELEQWGPPPKLLAVPGNHDLQWQNTRDVRLLYHWETDAEFRKEFWQETDNPYREVVNRAFAAYDKWWRDSPWKPDDVQPGWLPGDFFCTFVKDGFKLGIVGLNSAFLQLTKKRLGNSFRGHLAVEPEQFHGVLDGCDGVEWADSHHACFLMTHHPPEWLNQGSQEKLDQEIIESFDLHLCGHNHETEVFKNPDNAAESTPLRWVGRSLFGLEKISEGQLDRSHGYVSGELCSRGDGTTVRFAPRKRILPENAKTWSLAAEGKLGLPDDRHTQCFPIRVRGNPKTLTRPPGTAEEKPAVDDSVQPDTDPNEPLPEVVGSLRKLLTKRPDLHDELTTALREEMPGLQTGKPNTGSLDLIELTRQQGVNEVLDALFRWLDHSPRKNISVADWREVLTHLVVLAAGDRDWLLNARNQRDHDGVVPVDEKLVKEKLQPFSAAVLVSGVFDIAICLEGTQPAGHIPLAPGRGDKGHDSRDRYKAMIEFLQQKYRNFFTEPLDEDGIKQMLTTDRKHGNPRFVYLPDGDRLASEISDKLNGLVTVFVQKTAPRVLEENEGVCVLDQSLSLVRNIQELLGKLK